jgi:hypothetical protein
MAVSAGGRRLWQAAAAVAVAAVALGTPAAGRAAPGVTGAPGPAAVAAGNSPAGLARLEARAAALSRRYRGQLVLLDDARSAARARVARVAMARRQLAAARRELARLAAASYMSGMAGTAPLIAGGGDTRLLHAMATAEFVTRERSIERRSLQQFLAGERRAEQAARARVGVLRDMISALTRRRRRVDMLLARFRPQSPVLGPGITPRMQQVKDEIDRRFGPFPAIGCYRPESSGEHPLGRACDFMLSTGGVMPPASGVQRGYAIASWAQANASRLGIMYIIYRQRIWDIRMASPGWVTMADRGSITANHYDHVHISVF